MSVSFSGAPALAADEPTSWASAESFPVGSLVWDRPELGPVAGVKAAGSVHGVPMVVLFGELAVSPPLPAAALVGVVPPVPSGDEPALVEVAPAAALGAGPVLVFLAPWLSGAFGSLVLRPSDCSEFGFSLSGAAHDLLAVSRDLEARFGEAVLVGPLESAE